MLDAVERGVPRKEVSEFRTKEALLEATGAALDAITPEDIRGFYSDCGYRLPLQSF